MTGLPSQSSLESPICIARDLCPKDRRSSGANQRADRRSEYFFFCVITDLSSIRGLGSEYPKIEHQQAEVRAAFGMPKLTVSEFSELPRFLFTADEKSVTCHVNRPSLGDWDGTAQKYSVHHV